jgi:putative FmdB family regulatory protein
MPIYEFVCRSCGLRFEALVRLGKDGEVGCQACGGKEVRKLVSSFGIGGGGSRLKESSAGCSTCHGHSCSTCKT